MPSKQGLDAGHRISLRSEASWSLDIDVSFEITNDRRCERFRDLVSRACVEILGAALRYGRWTVTLREESPILFVVMTGPGKTREEWTFDLDRSPVQGPDGLVGQLRQRFAAAARLAAT